ncbi:MAG: hypothetical protein J6B44_07565 [Muribaculaceae bacterium]|nr:hypothetical protein [Muribaculaceae bacterium]
MVAYDGLQSYYMAGDYLSLYDATGNSEDLARAEAIIDREIPRLSQLVNYAVSLEPSQRNALGRSETYALQYLGLMTGLKNSIAIFRAIEGRPDREELLSKLPAGLSISYAQNVYPMLYLDGYELDELIQARDRSRGQTKEMFNVAVSLLELHNAAGVDPLLTTKAIADSNGVDINAWRNLVN